MLASVFAYLHAEHVFLSLYFLKVLNKLNLIFESTDGAVKEQFLQTEACRSKL